MTAPATHPTLSPRLPAVDGLRALAALAALAYHYADAWAGYGLLGVELFFVISGFAILASLERARPLSAFARARAKRLYPAYRVAVALAGALLLATGRTEPRVVLWSATMLQRFFGVPDLVHPYSTLALELWFYAVAASTRYRWCSCY